MKDPQELIAATELLLADARDRLANVTRDVESLTAQLEEYQRRAGVPSGSKPRFEKPRKSLVPKPGRKPPGYGGVIDAVLRVYRDNPRPISAPEGADILKGMGVKTKGDPITSFRNATRTLMDEGYVKKAGYGSYQIIQK